MRIFAWLGIKYTHGLKANTKVQLTDDWFSREEYEKFREDLQGKRIHIDAQSASTSKRKFDVPISLCDFVMKDLD
ncbi:hypothetical protein Taro_024421 [Colocasia esculenta]|uniref:Uncharacterized protein n=1 Tax=Colocasia esculenta TaxID=4460 RepID=A0A843V7D3_COLES|nr:hypothetical protein [Colocasia esculenta]